VCEDRRGKRDARDEHCDPPTFHSCLLRVNVTLLARASENPRRSRREGYDSCETWGSSGLFTLSVITCG
jgi:hypothetical protein